MDPGASQSASTICPLLLSLVLIKLDLIQKAIKQHIEFARTGGAVDSSSSSSLTRNSTTINRNNNLGRSNSRNESGTSSNRYNRSPSFGVSASSPPNPNQPSSISRRSIDMSSHEDALDDDDEDDENYGSSSRSRKPSQLAGLPHEKSIHLVANSIGLRIEQLQGLSTNDAIFAQTLQALKVAQEEYKGMVADRERWLISRYQHEIDGKLLWE